MFLKRRREEDRDTEARQKVIRFKKFFADHEGRELLTDLINKYFVLNPLPRLKNGKLDPVAEGQRDVVLYIMSQFHVDLAQFEKILKGDLT